MYDYGSVDETGKKLQYNWGYDPMNYFVPEDVYKRQGFAYSFK